MTLNDWLSNHVCNGNSCSLTSSNIVHVHRIFVSSRKILKSTEMFFLIYGIFSILLVASNTVDATTTCFNYSSVGKYDPDWESLDARPLPEWYMDAKVGIFMHFGPYAVPGKF